MKYFILIIAFLFIGCDTGRMEKIERINDYMTTWCDTTTGIVYLLYTNCNQAGFGHCLVCVEYYWNIVYGMRTFVFGTKKELEFASCGRDLRSIAEMMNTFHHERLSNAWRMIYG